MRWTILLEIPSKDPPRKSRRLASSRETLRRPARDTGDEDEGKERKRRRDEEEGMEEEEEERKDEKEGGGGIEMKEAE